MRMRFFLCLMVLCGLSGCGSTRQMGDVGGVPVTFNVSLDRAFVKAMENRQGRLGASAGVTVGSGGTRTGVGFGLSFSSTNVYLYGGNKAGQANVFRQKLKWGENSFEYPIKAGRDLVLSVVVSGGRSGWERVGSVKIKPQGNTVAVKLLETGSQVQDQ